MSRKKIFLITIASTLLLLLIGSFSFMKNMRPHPSESSKILVAPGDNGAVPTRTIPEESPNQDELDYQKATALIDSGMLSDAEPILKQLLERDPDNLKVIHELVTLYHTGLPNYPEAMRLEEKILIQEKTNTHEFERYRALAKLSKAEDRALGFLEDLQTADVKIAYMPSMIRGKIWEGMNQYPKAIESYKTALEIPSEHKGTINELLATVLVKARKYQEAEPVLLASIEQYDQYNRDHAANPKDRMSPQNAELKLLDVYLNNSQYQKALSLVDELLKTDSQNKQLLAAQDMARMGLKGGK